MQILSLHILHCKITEEMIHQVFLLLCSLALARAGIIGTHFSPATSVSTVYSSINNAAVTDTIGNPIYEKTAQIKYASPAPIYESVESTHESKTKGLDGSQQTTFTKTLDAAYSTVKNYNTRITNNGILTQSVPTIYSSPIQSSYFYSPGAYSVTSPVIGSILTKSVSPISYTHSAAPVVTKYSAPIVSKTIGPVTTYDSHGGQSVKTTITYSEAPLVSHMTFTGLGTTYEW